MGVIYFIILIQASSKVEGWRSDFLVEYQGEYKKKQPGCPTIGSGVSVSFYKISVLLFK